MLESLHIGHVLATELHAPIKFARLEELCMDGVGTVNVLNIKAPMLKRVHWRMTRRYSPEYHDRGEIMDQIMATAQLESLSVTLDSFPMSTLASVIEQLIASYAAAQCERRAVTLRFDIKPISSADGKLQWATSECAAQIKELIKILGEFKLTVVTRHLSRGSESDAIQSALHGLDDSLYACTFSNEQGAWVTRIESKNNKICGISPRWMYECACCDRSLV